MGRSAIVPELCFDAARVLGGASTNTAGTASREYAAGREARPAARGGSNAGGLDPVPAGAPESDVDVDVLLRASGNADTARWCQKDHSASVYKGKSPCGVLQDVGLVLTGNLTTTRISRPKLLPLASGGLLAMWVNGTSGNGGSAAYYLIWTPDHGWWVPASISDNALPLGVTMTDVLAVDAVQMPDTNEVVLVVMGYASSAIKLARLTAADSPSSGSLAWRATPCNYRQDQLGASPSLWGMALEVLASGRVAMLVHAHAQGTFRSYSDDRGVSWNPWALAGLYADPTAAALQGAVSTGVGGGVAIARARTGCLIAVAPAISGAFPASSQFGSSKGGWTQANNPRLRVLVSQDGDQWLDMVTASANKYGKPPVQAGAPTTPSTQDTGADETIFLVNLTSGWVKVGPAGAEQLALFPPQADFVLHNATQYVAIGQSRVAAVVAVNYNGSVYLQVVDGAAASTGAEAAPSDATVQAALPANATFKRIANCTINRTGDTTVTQSEAQVLATEDPTEQYVTQADGLLDEGVAEGAVAVTDDGLPRVAACLHGDPSGTTSSAIFDDLALLSMRKADVTTRDVGPALSVADVVALLRTHSPSTPDDGAVVVTCSDAFDTRQQSGAATWKPKTQTIPPFTPPAGAYFPSKPDLALARVSSLNAGSAGSGSGAIDGTVSYRGARFLDVVSYRGALWWLVATEDTGQSVTGLICARSGVWTESTEIPSDCSDASSFLKGRVYARGMLPANVPERFGWTKVGGATVTLDTTGGGVKIDAAAASYYHQDSLPGSGAAFVRANVQPTSGGSSSVDNIALHLHLTDAVNTYGVTLRFTASAIYVYDWHGALLGSVTGLTAPLGFEVALMMPAPNKLQAVHYKVVTTDPEDAVVQSINVGSAPVTLTGAAGATEMLAWGNQGAGAASVSTWRSVHFTRSGPAGSKMQLNDYAQYLSFPEFNDDGGGTYTAPDDGLRHGTRPPACCALPQQWARKGLLAAWQGASGRAADSWEAVSKSSYDVARAFRVPTGDYWRSDDDTVDSCIVLDAEQAAADGTFFGERFRPEAIALFGLNAAQVKVQFATSNSWGSPAVSITCDPTDAADVRRDYYRCSNGMTVEGNLNQVIRFSTGGSTVPFAPHQFRSTTRLAWYAYSDALNKCFKILDNDERRLLLDGNAAGAAASFVSVFCDRVAFALAGGSLATSGYRFMRIQIASTPVASGATAEGYHKLGLVVAGRKFALNSPHPNWGWEVGAQANVATLQAQSGYVDARQLGEAPRSWRFGFTGLRDRPDRANLSAVPGQRGGWRELLDFLDAVKWGEGVFALLPEYNDSIADGNASSFGNRALEVYPARVSGVFSGSHQAYDGCGSGEGLAKSIQDVQAVEFSEVL